MAMIDVASTEVHRNETNSSYHRIAIKLVAINTMNRVEQIGRQTCIGVTAASRLDMHLMVPKDTAIDRRRMIAQAVDTIDGRRYTFLSKKLTREQTWI
jgi:hypothetical protein